VKELSEFISAHRERFIIEHNNVFSFSFSKITRHWNFLEIIFERYVQTSDAFIENSKALRALTLPGTHRVTEEQAALMLAGSGLTTAVHLEIESFYLFAKIILDEIAHALEYYFGQARGLSLDSHDDLTKNLVAYAKAKGLAIPDEFETSVTNLRKRISDFRDYQIAHEKSPRTMRATIWGPDGHVRMASNKLYPKEKDQQVDTESLSELKLALEDHVRRVINFIEVNADKTNLKLEKPAAKNDH
jgi:hypothetical protein